VGAVLRYRDIGDYLTREEKLGILAAELQPTPERPASLSDAGWSIIQPNESGDWINQRSEAFATHMPAHSNTEPSIFGLRSNGLQTNRDAWNYNSSRKKLAENRARMIAHFNDQVDRFAATHGGLAGTLKSRAGIAADFVDRDPEKFSWDRANFADVARGRHYSEDDALTLIATYRPFHRRHATAGRVLNKEASQLPRVYPDAESENMTIAVSTIGARNQFSTLITRDLPDVHLWVDDTPCFPLYVYENTLAGEVVKEPGLFDGATAIEHAGRHHNVTDHALSAYQLLDAEIDRDDIFFYVYGILHSPDYRGAFAADLKKSLPRIPQVATAADFWAFSRAGRELAGLHTEYDAVEPWPELTYAHATAFDAEHPDAYRVLRMKHPRIADPMDSTGPKVEDRSRIVYNEWITIEGIPERAYGYELGSRSALAWVMESNRVRIDKSSGIRNDPNDWATEHGDRTYVLDLVGRVVTVSMRTLDIVDSLPHLAL
jgi:predicted helicase